MGSLVSVAIAAYIVLSGLVPQATNAGAGDYLSAKAVVSYEVTVKYRMKHPASRKTVSGPWPRFALEMLA